MITKVQKWGNGQGIRLSKELLSGTDIDVGDVVAISVHEGTLVVVPIHRVCGRVDLDQLVREIPVGYTPSELDWGTPTGREVW